MNCFLCKASFTISILLLLVSCQYPIKTKIPSLNPQIQINQLSALIASGIYIKKNCNRLDIPDDTILIQTALHLAQRRHWDTQVVEYQKLTDTSQARYQALLQDNTTHTKKCAQLNPLTEKFIAETKRHNRLFAKP